MNPRRYKIGEADPLQALQERFRCAGPETGGASVSYCDTFDWRLHRRGETICISRSGSEYDFQLQSTQGRVLRRLRSDLQPGFAWDLPQGPMRDELTPVLEMRRILPIVDVNRKSRHVSILDDEDKTVVRVFREERSVAAAGRRQRRRALAEVLRVVPVRGYPKVFRQLQKFLEGRLGLDPIPDGELEEALDAIGQRPEDYSSKLDLRLESDLRADDAAKTIHRALLQILGRNEQGVRRDLDSEFLHDFRVSVRRTRSALTQIKQVFPARSVDRFRAGFSWLGSEVTGPTRDMDVYLLKMESYKRNLPDSVTADLGPLEDYLAIRQKETHAAMVTALDSRRYRDLLSAWEAFLSKPVPARTPLANAMRPIGELARERIWRAWRRVFRDGRAITPETPAQALHDLRIDCKKLRYLMEFFRSLFPPKAIGPLIKSLKQLQDNLGDFNDFEVQQAKLAEFAQDMSNRGMATPASLMAMGRLVDRLEQGQQRERRLFHERFAKLDTIDNRKAIKILFRPTRKEKAPA